MTMSTGDSAVASPHWCASETGRDVLAAGGNALDAALATNAMLWACYPHMCGLGGDIWILYFDAATSRVHCLNGSGGASRRATPKEFTRRGHTRVPTKGPLSLAVPGAATSVTAVWSGLRSRAAKQQQQQAVETQAALRKTAEFLKPDTTSDIRFGKKAAGPTPKSAGP